MTDQVTFLFTGCCSELCPVGAGLGVSSRKTTGRVDSIRRSPHPQAASYWISAKKFMYLCFIFTISL